MSSPNEVSFPVLLARPRFFLLPCHFSLVTSPLSLPHCLFCFLPFTGDPAVFVNNSRSHSVAAQVHSIVNIRDSFYPSFSFLPLRVSSAFLLVPPPHPLAAPSAYTQLLQVTRDTYILVSIPVSERLLLSDRLVTLADSFCLSRYGVRTVH